MADDILKEAKDALETATSNEQEWRTQSVEDVRFARLGEQWPDDVRVKRENKSRPCLTINKMPAFIRQVVNDARQNKPSIKVHPVDSAADTETADIMNGMIRNIEYSSNADVAYDTAVECAVTGGVGYFRVSMDYAYDDAFEMDLRIDRIANPYSVYGDPHSVEADSSDWNTSLVVEPVPRKLFEEEYDSRAAVDFSAAAWSGISDPWLTEENVLKAEFWKRVEAEREIVLLSSGRTFAVEDLFGVTSIKDGLGAVDPKKIDPDLAPVAMSIIAGAVQIMSRRMARTHRVTQYIVSGVDVLETNEWPGRFIPIIPVYGDEFDVEGKRYFRSLIHHAKDAQRMMNYWRSASTELVALAPRVPYIGPTGSFATDADNWSTANTDNHPYLEYDPVAGAAPPTRQPLDSGAAAGALQEALNASDDMKAIIGLYDASLGARSNETSGRAILARQREGDVATFHFIDNLVRAIRHGGRVLIDLIPQVYDRPRVVRLIGEDGTERAAQINKPVPRIGDNGQPARDDQGDAIIDMHDVTAGKYDLTVTSGPSFTTRREEAAAQMTELVRAFPAAAPVIGDLMAKNFDWPGADEIAKRLEKINPAAQKVPPEIQKQMQEIVKRLQQAEAENAELKRGLQGDAIKAQTDKAKMSVDREKIDLEREKMDFERDKMVLEQERFMAENNLRQDMDENGNPRVVSRQDEMHAQLVALLQGLVAALSNMQAAQAAPKQVELQRDENGRAIGAVSYTMTTQ